MLSYNALYIHLHSASPGLKETSTWEALPASRGLPGVFAGPDERTASSGSTAPSPRPGAAGDSPRRKPGRAGGPGASVSQNGCKWVENRGKTTIMQRSSTTRNLCLRSRLVTARRKTPRSEATGDGGLGDSDDASSIRCGESQLIARCKDVTCVLDSAPWSMRGLRERAAKLEPSHRTGPANTQHALSSTD